MSRFRARWFGLASFVTSLFLLSGPWLISILCGTSFFRAVDAGLLVATPVDFFFVLLWWGGSHAAKHGIELEMGGGYWVYEPLYEVADEDGVAAEGGDVALDLDGLRREPKRIVKT